VGTSVGHDAVVAAVRVQNSATVHGVSHWHLTKETYVQSEASD
jgi:hypothetical protein